MQRLLLSLAVGATLACQQAPTTVLLQVPGARDAGPVTVAPDSGRPAPPPPPVPQGDAGVGPLPRSNRTLTTYRIFGETPIENLVMNPQLDLHTALTLFSLGGFGRRYHLASSPSGLPVLEIIGRDSTFIPVQPRPLPLEASIWIGRTGGPPVAIDVLLAGLTRDGAMQQASLIADAGSREERDGIVWQRFSGTTSATLLGQAQLIVNNLSDERLYTTGPVVVPIASGLRADHPIAPAIAMRPMDEGLRAKLEVIYARARDEAQRSIGSRSPALRRARAPAAAE